MAIDFDLSLEAPMHTFYILWEGYSMIIHDEEIPDYTGIQNLFILGRVGQKHVIEVVLKQNGKKEIALQWLHQKSSGVCKECKKEEWKQEMEKWLQIP